MHERSRRIARCSRRARRGPSASPSARLPASGPILKLGVEAERETPHWAFSGTVPIEIAGKRQRRIDVAKAGIAVADAEAASTTADVRGDVRRAYFIGRRGRTPHRGRAGARDDRDACPRRRAGTVSDRRGPPSRSAAVAAGAVAGAERRRGRARRAYRSAGRAECPARVSARRGARARRSARGRSGADAAGSHAAALDGNAELQVLQKRIDEERARVALAQAMRQPDPSVTGTFVYDSPPEFTFGWRAGAAIALPILTTGRADVAVAEANLDRPIADRDARRRRSPAPSRRPSLARRRRGRRVLRYQNEILPASLQVEQMADESYRAGQTGLPAPDPDAAGGAPDPPERPAGRPRLSAGARGSRARHGDGTAMRLATLLPHRLPPLR